MTKPVQQILGALFVNDSFRADMTVPNASISAVVQSYQYGPLTSAELAVVVNIVTSFQQGKMNAPVDAVRSECPHWPCN